MQQQAASFNRDQSNSLSDNSNQDDSGDYPEGPSSSGDSPAAQHQQHQQQPQASGHEPSESSGGPDPNQQGGGPEEEEFECPDDGIFADEASGCQSYLVCQSGAQVQQKFQCPLGTLFNNIILTCDFAHNVQCGKTARKLVSDPNDTIRGPSGAPSNQYQQPSTVNQDSRNHQNTPARPRYEQLPQPWQQHYPPSSSHQQQQQPAQTQPIALNIRPKQQQYQPASSPSESADSNDSEDQPESGRGSSDYETPEPLIPASLPNSPLARQQNQQQAARYQQHHRASGSSILPYKAPPAALANQNQQLNRQFQSAHKSQLRPTNYQVDPSAANYDGASVATPVYAEKPRYQPDDSSLSSTTSAKSVSTIAQGSSGTDQSSTFNLVINHLTKPVANTAAKPPSQFAPSTDNNYQQQQAIVQAKQTALKRQVQTDHQTPFKPMRSQLTPAVIPQHAKPANQQQRQNLQKQPENREPQHQKLPSIRPHAAVQTNSYHSLASQARPVHVVSDNKDNTNHNNHGQPTVIDLTSDKHIGVSSDAMNNGLLLIVRHSPSQQHRSQHQQNSIGPIGSSVASSTVSTTHASPMDQQVSNVVSSGKYSNLDKGNSDDLQPVQPKAYALDPTLVQPNSPIDAQLFPNVQNVLSNRQPQAMLNQQHRASSPANNQANSVHPPLGHLAPPKPTLIETTSHLQHQQQFNRDSNNDKKYPINQLHSAISSMEPINLILASGSTSATSSGFETGLRNRLIAASDQMATQSSWTTTTQATPTNEISSNNDRQQRPVTSNRRLRAAKAPDTSNRNYNQSNDWEAIRVDAQVLD